MIPFGFAFSVDFFFWIYPSFILSLFYWNRVFIEIVIAGLKKEKKGNGHGLQQ